MALACSATTSTNRCRARTSTVPTILPGRPVSPEIVLTTSFGTTPISAPTFIHNRFWKGWGWGLSLSLAGAFASAGLLGSLAVTGRTISGNGGLGAGAVAGGASTVG